MGSGIRAVDNCQRLSGFRSVAFLHAHTPPCIAVGHFGLVLLERDIPSVSWDDKPASAVAIGFDGHMLRRALPLRGPRRHLVEVAWRIARFGSPGRCRFARRHRGRLWWGHHLAHLRCGCDMGEVGRRLHCHRISRSVHLLRTGRYHAGALAALVQRNAHLEAQSRIGLDFDRYSIRAGYRRRLERTRLRLDRLEQRGIAEAFRYRLGRCSRGHARLVLRAVVQQGSLGHERRPPRPFSGFGKRPGTLCSPAPRG